MTAPNNQNDPEAVLSQALRAMAGGGRKHQPVPGAGAGTGPRLSTAQIVLIALIVGLVAGMGAGIVSLLI